jgi:RNA polymerase sigma factor (sigma-70 family)
MPDSAVDRHSPSRPITKWNPFDLAIHHSLATSQGLPTLPAYFHRRHDDELDDALSDPILSVMIVLVGSSSTGKTRALYEAIHRHAALRQWPLIYPQDARDLDRAFDDGRVVPNSVLWLNETQEHLAGAHGESVAARLRALVNGSVAGPVVVVGTLWPQHWGELTAEPAGGRDTHHHARQLLLHQVRRIHVPDRFTPAEIDGLDSGGATDPRLLFAAGTSMTTRKVIQTVAGGPLLVDRFEHPRTTDDRYAATVVATAMDARRLGHHNPLPLGLLRSAAPAYLNDDDRVDLPDNWFTVGLIRAAKDTVHGVTALLPRRTEPGPGLADAYELHDYLDQHGRSAADARNIPPSIWDALITHARTPDDLRRASRRASSRFLYHYAERLYRAAVQTGATWSRSELKDIVVKRRQLDQLRATVAARTGPADLDRVFFQQVIGNLGKLPELYRAAFVLRYMESLSLTEIAATLGIKASTVGKHLANARAVLRTELSTTTGR